MKKNFVCACLLFTAHCMLAQQPDAIINSKQVERIEKILSADNMEGRKAGTAGITKAGDFIAAEFKAAGLQTREGSNNYRQEFVIIRPKFVSISGTFGRMQLSEKNSIAVTSQPNLHVTPQSGYEKVTLKAGVDLFSEASKLVRAGKNYLVLVDTAFTASFSRLAGLKRMLFKSDNSMVFVLTAVDADAFEIQAKHEITATSMTNIVGVLPGKSKKNEFVIFSGHYDHLGIGKPVDGDSIYNGANDDAAGTTAVIMLARYFRALGNNERTLVFAAFTAEESGGYGSQYFSTRFEPAKVMAMFNIEMIGTDSKWGKNSAYITGYEKTDMGAILEKNLQGTGFTFHPDPYTEQQLFYRSDNATLAKQGVPAHTISTSKMDSEKYYHTVKDEIGTLDMDNMAMIIKAIALSSKSIVAGKDTPSRVDTTLLR